MSDINRELFTLGAIDDYGLDPYEFRILHRISRRGECWESAKEIATGCRMSYAQAREVLGVLEAARIIAAIKRPGKSDIFTVRPFAEWVEASALEGIRASMAPPSKTARKKPTVLPDSITPLPDSALAPLQGSHPLLHSSTPELQGSTRPLHSSRHEGNPIRESQKGNPNKERETEQAQAGLPLIGLVLSQPTKAEQTDGRRGDGRKEEKPGPPPADPELAGFRDRLKAHREATLGAPAGAGYFTQEANGIKTLWARVRDAQATEADCVELFNLKLNQWRARGMTGHLPNWLYVAQDIEPYLKNRNVTPMPASRSGYVTQADINRPGRGVVL